MATVSRCSSSDTPPYHPIAAERSTTLSPCSALSGMYVVSPPRSPADSALYSRTILSNASSS